MLNFPKRGEIWLASFNPGRGSEQKGTRPALVIQNDVGNEFSSTTIIAAISSNIKNYPFIVLLDERTTGLEKVSIVNLSQILTIDKKRLLKKIGQVNELTMSAVNQAIKISFALP